jgi:hypothetical protein
MGRDLELAKDPDKWMHWPQLPLKRPAGSNGGWLFNGSTEDDTVEPKVYRGTIFEGIDRENVVTYASLEELFADGWIVD